MAPSKAKKKEEKLAKLKQEGIEKPGRHVWIYGTPKIVEGSYEFHKNLQDHIENAFLKGKQKCKVVVYGKIWTLDFETMTESKKYYDKQPQIRRVLRSKLRKNHVVGIAGTLYERKDGFQQTDVTCSICFYPFTIPTRIENCGHVFCYICLKSNFKMGLDCPTCRGDIPSDLFRGPVRSDIDIHLECPEEYVKDMPGLFRTNEPGKNSVKPTDLRRSERKGRAKFYWIYESTDHFGYFRYDPKNEKYLEECYMRRKKRCRVFLCGYTMRIDFDDMTQERGSFANEHKREIKRISALDINKHDVKGIAGVRCHAYPIVD